MPGVSVVTISYQCAVLLEVGGGGVCVANRVLTPLQPQPPSEEANQTHGSLVELGHGGFSLSFGKGDH